MIVGTPSRTGLRGLGSEGDMTTQPVVDLWNLPVVDHNISPLLGMAPSCPESMKYMGGFVEGMEGWFRDASGEGVWGFSPSLAIKALFAPTVWACNKPYAIGLVVPPLAVLAAVLAYTGKRRFR